MPWKEVTVMEEKLQFASLAAGARYTVKELSDQFGVNRKTT